MSKVYLPSVPTRYDPLSQRRVPTIDLSRAEAYGSLKLLTNFQPGHDMDQALEDLKDGMADFQPDDYVAVTGDVILAAAAIAYACDMQGKVRVLRWDRVQGNYDCIEVHL